MRNISVIFILMLSVTVGFSQKTAPPNRPVAGPANKVLAPQPVLIQKPLVAGVANEAVILNQDSVPDNKITPSTAGHKDQSVPGVNGKKEE